jgi:cyclase
MLSKRLISCLDVRNGNLAKSIKFINTVEIGNPVEVAKKYYEEGIDELVFYDINASYENRSIMIDVVERVAREIFIPFSVGGGLRSVEDCYKVIMAGAEKVNINSAAVRNPKLISDVAERLGSQCAVLSMDVLNVDKSPQVPSGYEIVIDGGRQRTGIDAIAWAIKGEELGAGEIVVNSIDADGTKEGFNIPLTREIAEAVNVPVIASGGGGNPGHVYDVLTEGMADAALISSILHYNEYTIYDIKGFLKERGIEVR